MIESYSTLLTGDDSSHDGPKPPIGEAIGAVGLGLLGSALAERLVAGGYTVHGFDQGAAKSANVNLLRSSREVFRKCDTVIFSLPESRHVADVIAEVGDVLEAGRHTIIDTTTGDPDEMRQFYEQLKKVGIGYIEANIAGSSEAARQGDSPLFLGGEQAAIGKRQTLFRAMAKTSFVIGAAGSASTFKLVHNLLLGLNRAVLAETLEFGKALGFDAATMLDVLKRTPASSYVMVTKGERMVQSNFQAPQARLSQHLKDVCLILDHARRSGARTPLSELHRRLLEELESAGFGECDNSAIIAAFQNPKPDAGTNTLRSLT